MTPKSSYISVTDQFCGAGGSSQGATGVNGVQVVMALNHWKLAIETHNSNFPNTAHDCTDISACDPRRYPSTNILITSPECTNHSLAKGKQRKNQQPDLFGFNQPNPEEERSRATMWDVCRFAEFHNYNVIIVENVVDARYWVMWDAWIKAMKLLGYHHEIVYFNSMFAWPTPQSRDRMYVVFTKKGNKRPNLNLCPPAYCPRCQKNVEAVQSWKNPSKPKWGRYLRQYVYCCPTCAKIVQPYYFCAANAIDWTISGERIGDRKQPLKPRTLERIQYGLDKFSKGGFFMRYDGTHLRHPADAMPTQTTRDVMTMVLPFLVQVDYTHSESQRPHSVLEAIRTQTGRQVFALVATNQGQKYNIRNILEALPTQVASVQPSLILPFLISPNQRSNRAEGIDETFPTQTGSLGHALISAEPFLTSTNYFDEHLKGISDVFPTQTTGDKLGITVPPFLTSYYGSSQAHDVTDAVPTVPATDRHALVEPQTPAIEDCYFRMLQPHEIGRAMAFPDSYIVLGNSRQKVRQYGNAVTPPVMKMLVERCVETFQ